MNDYLLKELISRIQKLSKQLDDLKMASVIPSVTSINELDNKYYDSTQMRHMFHLSESKLQAMRKQEKIPFIKMGRRYLYPADAINSKFKN